jgi:DNA replication and repair protein RecF
VKLKKLKLENFRNYQKVEVELDSDLILVLGDNASGKTNFLESIYFLSRLKSFRAPENFLVNSEKAYFKLVGGTKAQALEALVQIQPRVKRGFSIDQKKTPRTGWKSYKTVLFIPSDLNLFTLGPAARRKYLNETLSQKTKTYAADLSSLEHILKQRSALLDEIYKQQKNPLELEIWNEQLAEVAIRISRTRREFIDFLNSKINQLYHDLTGFDYKLEIQYKGLDKDVDQGFFLALLKKHQNVEIRSGQNLVGPHRDDFNVFKDNEPNVYNSSRGELREQVLAIKLLQAEYLSEEKDQPIILLDDVFSELDETRRKKLLQNLSGHQIFITTTEEHHLPELGLDTKVLKVENNNIFPSRI